MSGKIIITVNKAILTKDVLTFGTMDPHFVAQISPRKTYKSEAKTNEGKYPIWKESFSFSHDENETTIEIDVFHESKQVIS